MQSYEGKEPSQQGRSSESRGRIIQFIVKNVDDILAYPTIVLICVLLNLFIVKNIIMFIITIISIILTVVKLYHLVSKREPKSKTNSLTVLKCSLPLFLLGMVTYSITASNSIPFQNIYEKIDVKSILQAKEVMIFTLSVFILLPLIVSHIVLKLYKDIILVEKFKEDKREREEDKREREEDKRERKELFNEHMKLIEENKQSNITNWDQLIGTIIEKKGDILIIVGNLMLINTEKGIAYLKKYLEANNNNEVKIITSEGSCKKQLDAIVDKISDANIASKITVISYQPFWFVQGIVIIAKRNKQYQDIIDPLGCFFYKIREFIDAEIPESGVYIDLSNQSELSDLGEMSEGLRAHYSILKKLSYNKHEYSVEKNYKRSDTDYDPKKEINLGDHFRSNSGTVH